MLGNKGGDEKKSSLGQALIDAVKDGDAEMVEEAFSALYMHCKNNNSEDSEDKEY